MVDMNRYQRRFLNEAALRQMDGERYEGIIDTVIEEPLRNRFTGTKELQPVIVFDDGWRLVPNITMRQALIAWWGPDTEEWIGRRVIVYRHRAERVIEKTNAVSGEVEKHVTERFEKRVMLPVAAAVEFPRRPAAGGSR